MQIEVASPTRNRAAELERAFSEFTATSLQLETAYRELEERVAVLSAALARAQDERLTQLKQKEQLAERLQGLLETLPAAVIVLDAAGVIEEHNPGAEALLGPALTGRPWTEVVAGNFAREGDCAGEFRLCDGRTVSLATRRLETSRIVLLTDVTETRRLQALLTRNQRLSEMGQMNARLAHQLRTPLATAVLYASQLHSDGATPRSQRFAGKILSSLKLLERMVNDMLRFAGGSGTGHQERIAVNDLFAAVAMQMESQLNDKIELQFGAPPGLAVVGDREALTGALLNLVTNAIDHGGDRVSVVLDAERGTSDLRLRVTDDGPGVAESERERIFAPFHTTRASGTGLGLAVVASVAHAHGGRVTVEEAPGGGAQFALVLPATNPAALDSGETGTVLRRLTEAAP